MQSDEYKCDDCGGIFRKGWSEENARAEQTENGWGDLDAGDIAMVCEDCYQKIMACGEGCQ